jgi:hypothetical protein
MSLLESVVGFLKRKGYVGKERADKDIYLSEEKRKIYEMSERINKFYNMLNGFGVGRVGIIPQSAREAGEERRKDGRYIRVKY